MFKVFLNAYSVKPFQHQRMAFAITTWNMIKTKKKAALMQHIVSWLNTKNNYNSNMNYANIKYCLNLSIYKYFTYLFEVTYLYEILDLREDDICTLLI